MRKFALLAAVALLSACAPQPRTLTFWAMGQEGERVGEILKPFLAQHPEIHLKLQAIPWGAAHDKLLTAYAGQSTPDVCQLGNTWVTEFEAMHALSPLDERVKASSVIRPGDYFPGIWASNVLDGKLYGVPWYVDTRALYYRRDLFARAGIPRAPETWAELSQAAKALTVDTNGDGKPDRYGIALPTNPAGSPIPLFFAWQNGADLLNASGTRAAVEDPRFGQAVDYYADFFRKGWCPKEVGGLTNFYQAFADGAFGMFISGPWDVKGLREKMPGLDGKWSVAPLPPRLPGGSRASLAGGSSLVLFRSSTQSDQAWALIEYLSSLPVQAAFYEATNDLPARKSSWNSKALQRDPEVRAFYAQLQHARPAPLVPEWEQLSDKLGTWIERVVYNTTSTPQAMHALGADLDHVLEKRRWLKARHP